MPSEAFALKQPERRSTRRFPLSLKLRYLLPDSSGGEGNVLDISSGGILFQTGAIVPVGGTADVVVMWPYLLNGDCPLQLLVKGMVLRSGPQGTALRISRYEFRTAPKSPERALRLLQGGKMGSRDWMQLMR